MFLNNFFEKLSALNNEEIRILSNLLDSSRALMASSVLGKPLKYELYSFIFFVIYLYKILKNVPA